MKSICKLIIIELTVNALVLLVSIIITLISHSNTSLMLLCVYGSAFLAGLASLYAVLAAMHGNHHQFPYGTGRMENACAFINVILLCICAVFSFIEAIKQFVVGTSVEPKLEVAGILIFLSLVCNIVFFMAINCIRKKTDNPTPIHESYYMMYYTATVRDAIIAVSMFIGYRLYLYGHFQPAGIDAVISAVLAVYIIIQAGPLVILNFRALVDFPLPEKMQIQILKVLGKHFDAYENIGRIFNTHRGNKQVIEVELMFSPTVSVASLNELQNSMQQEIRKHLPQSEFRIIPLSNPPCNANRVQL